MKRIKVIFIINIILFLVFPIYVYAGDRDLSEVFQVGEDFISEGSETDSNFIDDEIVASVNDIGRFLTAIGLVILVCVTLIIGIKYMLANPNVKAKLKKKLIWLNVSALIIFMSFTIWSKSVNFLQDMEMEIADLTVDYETGSNTNEESNKEMGEDVSDDTIDEEDEITDDEVSDDTIDEEDEITDDEISDDTIDGEDEIADDDIIIGEIPGIDESTRTDYEPKLESLEESKYIKDVKDEWSYDGENIKVTIQSFKYKNVLNRKYNDHTDAAKPTCYITRIWVKDPATQINQLSSQNNKKTPATFAKTAENNNGIILANVDCTTGGRHDLLVKNGKIIRNELKKDNIQGIALTPYGLKAYYKATADEVIEDANSGNIKATFRMWYLRKKEQQRYNMMLVYNGQKTKGGIQQKVRSARSIIAKVDNNNYFLITVLGYTGNSEKKKGKGLRLPQCQQLLLEIGCEWAFNWDGGQSTSLCYRTPSNVFSRQRQEAQNWTARKISDMIYFSYF